MGREPYHRNGSDHGGTGIRSLGSKNRSARRLTPSQISWHRICSSVSYPPIGEGVRDRLDSEFYCMLEDNMMEIEYGLALQPDVAKRIRSGLMSLFAMAHLLPFSSEDAQQSARLRADLKLKGQM